MQKIGYYDFPFANRTTIVLLLLSLIGCSGISTSPPKEDPGSGGKFGGNNISVLTGKPAGSGVSLDEIMTRDDPSPNGLPVNALLWRAALDVSSFVPIEDVDTLGGSIVTDWYVHEDSPDQRLKLSFFVIGAELRSDAIKVRAYLQKRNNSGWVDIGRDEDLSRRLENLVLSRARELRANNVLETTK